VIMPTSSVTMKNSSTDVPLCAPSPAAGGSIAPAAGSSTLGLCLALVYHCNGKELHVHARATARSALAPIASPLVGSHAQ
jgi:hypothetical protein